MTTVDFGTSNTMISASPADGVNCDWDATAGDHVDQLAGWEGPWIDIGGEG